MTISNTHSVWLVDDDQSIRWVLERALTQAEFAVTVFETGSSALSRYKRIPADERPQLILTDIRMPGISGFELLKQVKNVDSNQPVIIMTAYSDLDTTVQGYQQGAFEYLPKPFDIDDAIELVTRGCESHSRNKPALDESRPNDEIIGNSPALQTLFRKMGKLSSFNNHLLITGAHGTGKTITAQRIHDSDTGNSPLVALGISTSTTETDITELLAPFEGKSNVTLLLKNIDTLPQAAQISLSKALSQSALNSKKSTVRIIATTSANLHELVQQGSFDLALYHQLNETSLTVPTLKERRSDIPALISHYLNQFCHELSEEPMSVETEAMTFLQQYEWPGNISQLKNLCRSMSLSPDRTIGLQQLPGDFFESQPSDLTATNDKQTIEWEYQLGLWAMRELAAGHRNILPEANSTLERKLLECALQVTKGRKHDAAKLLGWGRNTLTRKLKEFY